MITAAKNITLILGLTAASSLWGATYEYQALTDFSDIDAGEVPYYRHNSVNALAIDAAIEEYREKFARATVTFEQSAGLYNVTIASLGETDGDGEFRFLVDGEVLGSAINEPATEDYVLQYHTFENISIPAGAVLGVESSAVSNGLIPEGDAYAYARGRWVTLTLSSVEEDTPTIDPVQTIDLSLSLAADTETTSLFKIVNYVIEVENTSDELTATNPVITINLPNGLSAPASDLCNLSDTETMTCLLPELGPGSSTNVTMYATATVAGDLDISASIQADQDDNDSTNNSETITTTVTGPTDNAPIEDIDNTIDLTVTLSADKDQVAVGDTITYTVMLANKHASNTVDLPTAGILLPDSLRFIESDTCNPVNNSVICNTESLAPETDTTIFFTAEALAADSNANLFAAASSPQPDAFVANNDAQLTSKVTSAVTQNAGPAATTEAQTSDSGGGSWGFLALQFLALVTLWQRRRLRSAL